eukprot:NODE_82_length_22625_cov_0.476516.p7 type:complete len:271 gc:universal NODE_82_length_22625_cov_0.476516:5318-4506(-)
MFWRGNRDQTLLKMTNVGYVEKRNAAFWKAIDTDDYCVLINQLGGSPNNFNTEYHCEQCSKLMALICQYSKKIDNLVRTIYCYACKQGCNEVKIARIHREWLKVDLPNELRGLEDVCCPKLESKNPKNNTKMYKRYEILEDEEEDDDEEFSKDSLGFLLYQEAFPSTVIRWTQNIFITDQTRDTKFKKCTCGQNRILECQILPNSLYYLKQKEEMNSLDFGTILIGTCPSNCGSLNEVKLEQAIKMTFKDPPRSEEGLYEYSHLLNKQNE